MTFSRQQKRHIGGHHLRRGSKSHGSGGFRWLSTSIYVILGLMVIHLMISEGDPPPVRPTMNGKTTKNKSRLSGAEPVLSSSSSKKKLPSYRQKEHANLVASIVAENDLFTRTSDENLRQKVDPTDYLQRSKDEGERKDSEDTTTHDNTAALDANNENEGEVNWTVNNGEDSGTEIVETENNDNPPPEEEGKAEGGEDDSDEDETDLADNVLGLAAHVDGVLATLRNSAQEHMETVSQQLDIELKDHKSQIGTLVRPITQKYFASSEVQVEQLVFDRLKESTLKSLQDQVDLFIAQASEDIDSLVVDKEEEGEDVIQISQALDDFEQDTIPELEGEIFKIAEGLRNGFPFSVPNMAQDTIERLFEKMVGHPVTLEQDMFARFVVEEPAQLDVGNVSGDQLTALIQAVLVDDTTDSQDDENKGRGSNDAAKEDEEKAEVDDEEKAEGDEKDDADEEGGEKGENKTEEGEVAEGGEQVEKEEEAEEKPEGAQGEEKEEAQTAEGDGAAEDAEEAPPKEGEANEEGEGAEGATAEEKGDEKTGEEVAEGINQVTDGDETAGEEGAGETAGANEGEETEGTKEAADEGGETTEEAKNEAEGSEDEEIGGTAKKSAGMEGKTEEGVEVTKVGEKKSEDSDDEEIGGKKEAETETEGENETPKDDNEAGGEETPAAPATEGEETANNEEGAKEGEGTPAGGEEANANPEDTGAAAGTEATMRKLEAKKKQKKKEKTRRQKKTANAKADDTEAADAETPEEETEVAEKMIPGEDDDAARKALEKRTAWRKRMEKTWLQAPEEETEVAEKMIPGEDAVAAARKALEKRTARKKRMEKTTKKQVGKPEERPLRTGTKTRKRKQQPNGHDEIITPTNNAEI